MNNGQHVTAVEAGLALLLVSMLCFSFAAWRRAHSWLLIGVIVALHIALAWMAGFIV